MGSIFEKVDVVDLIGFVKRKNRSYQRAALDGLEQVFDKDSPEYKRARGIFLDSFNDYTRSILQLIFGDSFEGKIS
jgi:hypothetical protein